MFDTAIYWCQLRKLQRMKRKSSAHYSRLISLEKSQDEINKLVSVAMHEDSASDDAISELHSRFLIQQAQAHLIPVRDASTTNGVWERSDFSNKWRLSSPEQVKLRSAIRLEKQERSDALIRWIPVVSGFTGLLGVVVVILALIL